MAELSQWYITVQLRNPTSFGKRGTTIRQFEYVGVILSDTFVKNSQWLLVSFKIQFIKGTAIFDSKLLSY